MESRHGNLSVTTEGRDLELANARVCVRLVMRDGGYAREFYATGPGGKRQLVLSSIHKNLIASSEHRTCSSPMIAGDRQHLFGVCRESLRMVYSTAEVTRHDEQALTVRLHGTVTGHELTCEITLKDASNAVHVVVHDHIARGPSDPVLEYLMSSYAFLPDGRMLTDQRQIDYSWAPLLRPGSDQVIGDRAFHSPAAIVQQGRLAAALIPDMDTLAASRPLPASLDLDLSNGLLFAPLLSYGLCGYEPVDGDRHCRHDITMARRISEHHISYGYHLLLDANCKPHSAHREVARFLWARYGSRGSADTHRPCALIAGDPSALTPDAQTAYGLCAGDHSQSSEPRAREMVEALLSAPLEGGLFPTAFDQSTRRWIGCRFSVDGGRFSTVECSEQLYWLLKWHSRIGQDDRIISRCRRYADYIIETRMRSGAVPSWYTHDFVPLSALRSGAPTAATALLLAELAKVTGLAKYSKAFQQSARFVVDTVVGQWSFLDQTCIDTQRMRTLECADPHTGSRPQCGHALVRTAATCLELYLLTKNRSHLETGLRVLDQACLLQSVCDRPWESDSFVRGTCAGGNLSPVPDPELTAEFGLCALRYGAVTGEQEYFHRGRVALYSAMDMKGLPAATRARIAAVAADAEAEFGAVYVHVGKKWASETVRPRIERCEISLGKITLDLRDHSNGNGGGRIVFGGLRGSSYKVSINNSTRTWRRDDLARGIPARVPLEQRPGQDSLKPEQQTLFD